MQSVSKAYKESMNSIVRNRGYIRVTIGVINSEAQKNVNADDIRNFFTYYSNAKKPFQGYTVDNVYATMEQNFSKLDGSMYFLPSQDSHYEYYNNGLVTDELLGAIYICFSDVSALDIKGLTIDFGECYPTDFTIENNGTTRTYNGNDKRLFVTEDVFNGTSYFIIRPIAMVNGQNRLRIYQFSCGITNVFTNKEVLNYTSKEYVSSITDTIPSNDVTISVDNQNLYYSADNPNSTIAFMEVGQEVKTEFGYDVTGNGDIEWLLPTTAYLKTWTSDDKQAKFTATDRFDYLVGTYYKGLYRPSGISLYDLAIDVLHDANITDEREYFVDTYLQNIIVYNPMPIVKHSEALQIIANAGRCVLYEDRQSRIHIQSSFVPDMSASANNETAYSHGSNVLVDDVKDAYAINSNDFSVADGNMYFMPTSSDYLNTGYISQSIADEYGVFDGENPKITINLEAGYVAYGLAINFRSVAPREFHVRTYYENSLVNDMVVDNAEVDYITSEQFDLFDKMEIEATVGYPNARVTIDNVKIGGTIDYTLDRSKNLSTSPMATLQQKIKSISVEKTTYNLSEEDAKELFKGDVVPDSTSQHIVYFTKPCYDFSVIVNENDNVSASIIESSSYYVKLQFSGSLANIPSCNITVSGKEYIPNTNNLVVNHEASGKEIEWKNPLVSDTQHAIDLEEWLASYYLGYVDYDIKWRGDPRTDANDLFYLQLKDRDNTVVRSYQNEIKFSGAWSGSMKARKVVL